eukprot:63397-Pleurochrysis_carterae.AAC.1
MAGAFDELPSRDVRPLEVRDDAYSGLLARVRGSPDPRVTRASRSSRDGSGDKSRPNGTLVMHGSSGLDMTIVLDGTRPGEDCGLDKKGETPANPPPPEKHRKLTLAVEKDDETLLIPPPLVKGGQAEKESVELTPHSP